MFKHSGKLDLDSLLRLLVERGHITEANRVDVNVRAQNIRVRVIQNKMGGRPDPRAVRKIHRYEPHPVEIVAEAKLTDQKNAGSALDERAIFRIIAEESGVPFHLIDPLKLDPKIVTSTFSRPFARKHNIVPIAKEDSKLTVAICDPWDTELFENISKLTGLALEKVVATRSDIYQVITEFHGFRQSISAAEKVYSYNVNIGNLEQFFKLKAVEQIEATDRHIINAVEYLLHYAFNNRASDIHIEPKREYSLIRLRIDGVLHPINTLPASIHPAFISRIKMMARMDIAEKRKPQDGRIKTLQGNREIELRISTLPTAFGEKVVIRIFDPQLLVKDYEELGFFPEELKQFQKFVSEPNGLILVTGPTGSGKTTTLYTALRNLAGPEINVTTIEDPIEMVYEELNQTGVQPKIGITFASSLAHILRQDPDVIMVGEIRDPETAENAIQAALTGHLVFSTLHTNDTAGAITRMIELGAKPFLLASVLTGIVAQRLVRKICQDCVAETLLTKEEVLALGIPLPEDEERLLPVKYGVGCPTCRGTGYFGRTAVFEVMPANYKIRRLINESADSKEIMKVARLDGMATLRENAIRKLATGITTFDEVIRITSENYD
ncbi:MAG: GspE/PulE family protein [Myxococcota bacterium]